MKASHKQHSVLVGNQVVDLLPGQFIFGRKAASEETGMGQQEIRTCVKILEKMENLTIKPTNKFSIITIINWDTYQSQDEKPTSKLTNNQPTTNQQLTTNKNVKKGKKNSPELPVEPSEPPVVLIELVTKDENDNPETHGVTKSDIALYKDTYPGIDVLAEIKKCRQWNHDNPKKRKTAGGIRKHINSWLDRAQNNASRYLPPKKKAPELNRGFNPDNCEVVTFDE